MDSGSFSIILGRLIFVEILESGISNILSALISTFGAFSLIKAPKEEEQLFY